MNKKLFLMGAPLSFPKSENFMVDFERSGFNFGNIHIANGIASVLDGYDIQYTTDSPEKINEEFDCLVIAAANFLWKDFDFGAMADFLEKIKLPITMIGVGAQTNDRSDIAKIHPNTLRMMKIISERSPEIGVRGYYTAEVLSANGIQNINVIGCPSIYANCSPTTAFRISSNLFENMAVNFSRRVADHSFNKNYLMSVENALLKIAIDNDAEFIAQDEIEEIAISYGNKSNEFIDDIKIYFNQKNINEVVNYFETRLRYFTNYIEWKNTIKQKNLIVGSRLHGNLIALINGIPSLTIVHDSRTLEMCALTGAPYIHINSAENVNYNDNIIIEKINNINYELFINNHKNLFIKYKNFLDLSGLNHKILI